MHIILRVTRINLDAIRKLERAGYVVTVIITK